MEERIWIGIARHRDLDEQRIERPLARDTVHELAEWHRVHGEAHPDRVQIGLDLPRGRGPGRLVRRRDGEGELLPALVTDAVTVVVLPTGPVKKRDLFLGGGCVAGHVLHVRPRARGHELVGDGPASVRRELQHAPAVDGGRDRLSHGTIAEDDLLGTDIQEQRHEIVRREAVKDSALERPSALAVLAGETADSVHLSARQGEQRIRLVWVEAKDDLVQIRTAAGRARAIEVVGPQQHDLPSVDLCHSEWTRSDRARVEGLPRKLGVRHVPEQVRRKQRHGRAIGERPVHIWQRETHAPHRDLVHGYAAKSVAVRADVAAVLKEPDREYDVVCRDGLPVMPRGVLADVECPDATVALGVERGREVRNDRAGPVVPGQAAKREPCDVLIDVRRRDDRIQVLRNAGNALDIRAAVGRVPARWVLVRGDRRDARNDHEPDEGDNDDLVAPGHLAGGRLPSAPERYRDEEQDEDDRQPKERPLERPTAPIRGRLTTERGREPGTARLQEDRGRDRDGNDDLTYLKGVHGWTQRRCSARQVDPEIHDVLRKAV